MSVPDIRRLSTVLHNLDPAYKATPWTSAWWSQNYAQGIPGDAVPWMLAQGWQIVSVYNNTTTTPPTPYYTMARQQMNNWVILQQLINDFTGAYNEGRQKNALRYDDIVRGWCELIAKSSDSLDAIGDHKNAFTTNYSSSLSALVDVIDAQIAASLGVVVADNGIVSSQLATFLAKLGDFEINYAAHAAKIENIITLESAGLTAYLSSYETELAKLATEYNSHLSNLRDIESVLASDSTNHIASYTSHLNYLTTDFTSHRSLATGYLTNLGATELARINEQFDNSLAANLQNLMDRGFYSSALVTSVTERNTRERNEAIVKLNDGLAREKLENQHRLYEQQTAMRQATLQGLDQVYKIRVAIQQMKQDTEYKLQSELFDVRNKIAEGIDRRHLQQQDVERNEANQRDKLLDQLQEAIGKNLTGQQQYVAATLDNSKYVTDARQRLLSLQMQADEVRLKGKMDTHLGESGLMENQLSVRNKLILDLFGFMEKRTDSYPDLDKIAQLATALGDAGSTQLVGA